MTLNDVSQVFEKELLHLRESAGSENYSSCKKLASNLIRWSSTMEHEDGIFIGEVLEAIFNEIDDLFSSFDVSAEDKQAIKNSSIECLSTLVANFKEPNNHKVYSSLKALRVMATKSQFKYWDTFEPKPQRKVFGMGS